MAPAAAPALPAPPFELTQLTHRSTYSVTPASGGFYYEVPDALGYGLRIQLQAEEDSDVKELGRGIGISLSPDGSQILFSRTELDLVAEWDGHSADRSGDIWLAHADGTSQVRLTDAEDNEFFANPDWSPDGSRIVLARTIRAGSGFDYGEPVLEVMNADGSDRQSLGHIGFDPEWSPDGGEILFTHRTEAGSDLRILTLADGSVRPLTDSTRIRAYDGAWSPDGNEIAFVAEPLDGSKESDIFVILRDESRRLNLTLQWDQPFAELVFTPGGESLAAVRLISGPEGLGQLITSIPHPASEAPRRNFARFLEAPLTNSRKVRLQVGLHPRAAIYRISDDPRAISQAPWRAVRSRTEVAPWLLRRSDLDTGPRRTLWVQMFSVKRFSTQRQSPCSAASAGSSAAQRSGSTPPVR